LDAIVTDGGRGRKPGFHIARLEQIPLSGELTPDPGEAVGLERLQANCSIISATGDLIGTAASPIDALLGSLADNGGPTVGAPTSSSPLLTHALLTGSPAIDAGNPDTPGSGGTACEATDQRGFARPEDGDSNGSSLCDIGALEVSMLPSADSTTTLASNLNPSVFGQAVTFTAAVSTVAPGAGTPTGTVTFRDGATTLGTGSLSAG
jgi:hypothetical protein